MSYKFVRKISYLILGNVETRVATINKAASLERSGFVPSFEYRTFSNKYIDLIGLDPISRKPVTPVFQFTKLNRLWYDEIPTGFKITRDTGLPVSYIVTGR